MKNRKKKRTMNPKNKTKMSNMERDDYNLVKNAIANHAAVVTHLINAIRGSEWTKGERE